MSGITMCDADECPLSIACYRHADSGTRPDPHYQSYWARRPESPVGYDCAMFWSEAASLRAESARARVEQSVAEEESSIARQPPDRLKR